MKPALFSPKRHAIPLILLFVLGICSAFADYTGETRWTITTVDIATEGSTRESVLRRALDIKQGAVFGSLKELESYLSDKRKTLDSIRIFQTTSLEYDIGEEADGSFPVSVRIRTTDTWNIVALPYPRYDSNDGLQLSVKMRNYNAFGSMEPLYLDIDYRLTTDQKNSFGTSLSFTAPLEWQKESWALFTSHSLIFPLESPVKYTGYVGIRKLFDHPVLPSYLQLRQGVIVRGLGIDRPDNWYFRTEAGAFARLKLFPGLFRDTASLSFDLKFGLNYQPGFELPASIAGPDLKLTNQLGAGRIDWSGNFRQGWLVAFKNEVSYRFTGSAVGDLFTASFQTEVPLYKGLLGTSMRLVGLAAYPDPADGLGSYLRGVRDDGIEADLGAFANCSLTAKLFDFLPSRFISKRWLDMEVQGSLFFDAALVRPSISAAPELQMSTGVEFLAYPKLARSMFARISAGFDILHYAESDNLASALELFFGLGAHY